MYLHRYPFSPLVLRPRQILRRLPEIGVVGWIEDPGGGFELAARERNGDARVLRDVLHPLRAFEVLGENVDRAMVEHEPDLDAPRKTAHAPGRRDVHIRLV